MFWSIIWRRTNSSNLAKWTEKLGALVKIYIFYWDNMVFLWGFCLLPEKMALFFSILNKYLPIVARFLEVFCRISEYPAKSTSSEFIYCRRTVEFPRERTPPVLISGKMIWEKNLSFVRITFSCKTGQPVSTSWRRDKHLFYRTSPISWF